MLCAKCHSVIKPVVAIDIDGTLGDYHWHFWHFACNYLGLSRQNRDMIDQYEGEMNYRDWFCEVFSVDLTTFREVKLAYRQGGMKRTMPVFGEVSGFTRGLVMAGYEVWLTTTRPYLRLDGVDRDTREWLRRHSVTYDHLLYDEEKYEVLSQHIDSDRVLAVLDDEIEQLTKAEYALGAGVGILRRTAYNAAAQWEGPEALNMTRAYELITTRLKDWDVH